jgi:hypothetical protein
VADFPIAAVAPETYAADVIVRNPNRIVVTVGFRIVWMAHTCEGAAGRADYGKYERPVKRGAEVVSGNLDAIALKRSLMIGLRYDLHTRDWLWSGRCGL